MLLKDAREKKIKSMVIPALATGVGKVSKEDVAKAFKEILGEVKDIDITVMDINEDFIKLCKDD